jgi:CysZ protein
MKNNPVTGFNHLLQGLGMLRQPGLKRYLLVPLAINLLIFSLVGWVGYSQFTAFMEWALPEASWYSFLRWLLWPLFALTAMLVTFYTFTVVANLIAAPFNGLLAARVEELLTGQRPPESEEKLARIIVPAILSELRKLGYFLIRAIPLLVLFLIPGLNLVAPLLWILFSAWFLALEYMDYPMGNHGMDFRQQHQELKKTRLSALGFGGGVTLLMMVPILNFAAMPAAVIGATRFWLEQKRSSG